MSAIHQMKTQRASVMLSDVRQLVSSGASVNQKNEDGVTLVNTHSPHLTSALTQLLFDIVEGVINDMNEVFAIKTI